MGTIITSIIILSLIGAVSGGFLAYASEKFKVIVDPRVQHVLELLPRANCGACGYPSCIMLAEAMVSGKAEVSACKIGDESMAESIAKLLGK